jgi:methylated-DNA-[protein]-cysteine S-methyltransferase
MTHYGHSFATRCGTITLTVDPSRALTTLEFSLSSDRALETQKRHAAGLPGLLWDAERCAVPTRQVQEYFDGQRTAFDLPLNARGTQFQQRVWAELRRIPYGTTISYGELARRLGLNDHAAARAVGAANGANPIGIVVPCHRVIGADGKLVGYAGGLDVKRKLLELEGALAPLFAS